MSLEKTRGSVYRCPVCGAEIAVLSHRMGDFAPRCCGVAMAVTAQRIAFYVCPVCKAEIAIVNEGTGAFAPRCCSVEMTRTAA